VVGLLMMVACAKPGPAKPTTTVPRAATVPEAAPPAEPCQVLHVCLARVGEVDIPYADFAELYALRIDRYEAEGMPIPPEDDRRYREVLSQRLIYQEMLAQEFAALGLEDDPAAVDARMQQERRGVRDWAGYLQRRSETDDSVRAMLIAELRERRILDARGVLRVTADEVAEDYATRMATWNSDVPRVRASHILIPIGPEHPSDFETDAERARWDAEAKAKAEAIHAEVTRPGADFAAIARERTVGRLRDVGGDVGIFAQAQMEETFARAAFSLEVGQISKPVRTKFGYHVIQLTGKWPPGVLPIEAVEDQIREGIAERKLAQARAALRETLTAKYEVRDNMKPTLGPEEP